MTDFSDSHKATGSLQGVGQSPDPTDPADAGAVCESILRQQWELAERQLSVSAEDLFQRYPILMQDPDRQVDVVYNEFLIAC
ncbi:MAG: hypothetical protein KDA85_11870, partial [Planctomycetaceae bacterium]|nr:hypothetical protein [Planctomycetaceae bacterium]